MESDRIPKSYIVQDGCHNCSFVFIWEEWDSSICYYCTKFDKRPKCCCSIAMKESPLTDISFSLSKFILNSRENIKEEAKIRGIWNEWAETHEVKAMGICGEYIKIEPSTECTHAHEEVQ